MLTTMKRVTPDANTRVLGAATTTNDAHLQVGCIALHETAAEGRPDQRETPS